MRGSILVGLISLVFVQNSYAKNNPESYYRRILNPSYHGALLGYCTLDQQSCGIKVAHRYCQLMGYKNASQAIIAHNVGITRFIDSEAHCKGWDCNGFKLIRCESEMKHEPIKAYYYRSQNFAVPRANHYRIDWCYQTGTGCGERAAHSFCRRMGYLKATRFEKDIAVFATKTIGDQALCFGKQCSGFKHITCYR